MMCGLMLFLCRLAAVVRLLSDSGITDVHNYTFIVLCLLLVCAAITILAFFYFCIDVNLLFVDFSGAAHLDKHAWNNPWYRLTILLRSETG